MGKVLTLLKSNAGTSRSGNGSDGHSGTYYPSRSQVLCTNDGQQGEWVTPSDMFESPDSCCEHHFSWSMATCLKDSPALPSLSPTPKRGTKNQDKEGKAKGTAQRRRN